MVKFTPADRAILDSYKCTCADLAKMFGPFCEFVLHSLENLEESVVAIENGHISGRSVGAPITNLALEMVHRSRNSEVIKPYRSSGVEGIPLRSMTTPIYNGDKLIGLMCINMNLNVPLTELAKWDQILQAPEKESEFFGLAVEDMMLNMMQKVESEVTKNREIPYQDKNKIIITRLDQMGFFRLKGSVEILSDQLRISPHTVYAILRKNTNSKDNFSL